MTLQRSYGSNIYRCMQCGAPCSRKFVVRTYRLPFCDVRHKNTWMVAERERPRRKKKK